MTILRIGIFLLCPWLPGLIWNFSVFYWKFFRPQKVDTGKVTEYSSLVRFKCANSDNLSRLISTVLDVSVIDNSDKDQVGPALKKLSIMTLDDNLVVLVENVRIVSIIKNQNALIFLWIDTLKSEMEMILENQIKIWLVHVPHITTQVNLLK